jgi:EmrB/QacA subfamily drug resistance transporter
MSAVGGRDRTHYRVTLAVLTLGAIAYALLQSLVLPALPVIEHSLHVSQASVTWVLTTYLLTASVATPTVGRLGDMYGKHHVLGVVMGILALGTLVSALASSIGLLLVGRLLQGVGGGIFPLGFGIIRDEFPPERVAGGIGLMSSLIGIGGGLGVVLSGVVIDHASYHWLFWLPFVVIVAATVAVYVFVPESPVRVPGRVNWLSMVLMSVGLTIVLLATSEARSWGWLSAKTIGLIVFGAVILGAWVLVELRSDQPLVDMRLMRVRGVWTTNVGAFLIGMGLYSSFILIPQFVQEPVRTGYGFGASVLAAGIFFAPTTLAMLVVGQFNGVLDRLVGSRATLIGGAAFAAAAFILLASIPSTHAAIYGASTLLGIGTGLAFAATPNLIVQNVRQDQTGVATGMNTVMRTLGGALGGQLAATLLAGSLGAFGSPTSSGYTLAFGLCAGAVLAAIPVALLIPGRRAVHVRPLATAPHEGDLAPASLLPPVRT